MQYRYILILSVTIAFMLSSCSFTNQMYGPDISLKKDKIKQFVSEQNDSFDELVELAGYSSDKTDGIDYNQVLDAGFIYADVECDKYIENIFWVKRKYDAHISELSATSTGVAGILEAVRAASNSITLTAIGFGLMTNTLNNYTSMLLYSLEPYAIKDLIIKAKSVYLSDIKNKISNNMITLNKLNTLRIIQAYISLCLPCTVEMLVNQSTQKAKLTTTTTPVVEPGNAETSQPSQGEVTGRGGNAIPGESTSSNNLVPLGVKVTD